MYVQPGCKIAQMRYFGFEKEEESMSDFREIPSGRPQLGPSPTDGDEFFHRLDEAAKKLYGDGKKETKSPSSGDDHGYDGEGD